MRRHVFAWLAVAALVCLPAFLSAQGTRSVTGQVRAAESNQPLQAVRVTVKGTNVGTVTNADGRFTLQVPASATTLHFAVIGYKAVEVPVQDVVDVTLERQAILLEGIVTTALGIEREQRSLGYSVQEVSGEQLAGVPKLNVVDALHGQVAGVQITNTGNPGGASRIVIRGASSIAGNNQPLFIVDGIPIDNRSLSNNGGGNTTGGGYDYGNHAGDIDPNNIESISVLKGPTAAALYGSRAANGAVVITTKKGHSGGGIGITASTGVTWENPLRLPSYQNVYGQGFNGQFSWVDGNYGGVNDGVDESWGPKMDCQPVDQFFGDAEPFCPHPDNVRDFFRTGTTAYNSVALARSDERSSVRLSVTHNGVNSLYPTNEFQRLSAALTGSFNLTERMRTDASVNYMNHEAQNRVGTGYTGYNPFQQFVWFGRQVDVGMLRNYKCAPNDTRRPCTLGYDRFNWNYSYHENPYFEAYENTNEDATNRIIGHGSVSYDFTDWLTGMVRYGSDWYEESRKRRYGYGGIETPFGTFADDEIFHSETNVDFLLTAKRALTPDWTFAVNAGGNRRDEEFRLHNITVSELVVPGIFTVDNARSTPTTNDVISRRRANSLYGSANVNYRDFLSVDVTGRNDWSSTLPAENNSYFYPSVSGAFVFTDALNVRSRMLSSGKVRASWTRVGNDADPYLTSAVFQKVDPFGGIPKFTVPNELPNTTLKPEETTAWEIGADLGFLDERLGFVLTYYDNRTVNQIMGVQISGASGYTNQVLNAGEVRNWGTELLLMATPLRLPNGLQWDMTLNWAKNNSEVVDLYGDVETLVLGTYWGLNVEARKGYPYGVLFGTPYLRDPQGRIVVHATGGYPLADAANRRVLGNYQPDWNGGLLNRFRYKGVDLSFLIDMQRGGDVFSVTNMFGRYSGVLEQTLEGRQNGVGAGIGPINGATGAPVDCSPGILVPNSVYQDASGNYVENTDRWVCPQTYNHALYGRHEAHLFDASYVKLREVRLTFQVPSRWLERVGIAGAEVSLVGRNLALWTDMPNIDPETAFSATNVQGLEYGQFPTARTFGFTLTLRP